MAEVRFKGRIVALVAVVLLIFAGIGSRLALLHLRPDDWVLEPIEEGRMYEWKPVGSRGRIVDRNGEILAMDRPAYHVYIDPKYISEYGDADAVAESLSMEFKVPQEMVRGKLAKLAEAMNS